MQAVHSVSIEEGFSADGAPCFLIKLQGPECELNVTASAREIEELRAVGSARWLDRKSLRVGQCLGALLVALVVPALVLGAFYYARVA